MTENAKKLIAALRGGEYEQAHERLRKGDAFCCLGVACDLYAKAHGESWTQKDDEWYFLGVAEFLPGEVQEWLGFLDNDGAFAGPARSTSLAERNDGGTSFEDIADIIESEPEGLFA
jgi:hypothetical protein